MVEKILVSFALLVCLGLQHCVHTAAVNSTEQLAKDGESVIKEQVLALEFLASCLGTNFYLDADMNTQSGARAACQTFGMEAATFSSRSQLQCVAVALTDNIPFAWTDGELIITPSSYQSGGEFVASDILITYYVGTMCGLQLNNDNMNPRLMAVQESSLARTICMLKNRYQY